MIDFDCSVTPLKESVVHNCHYTTNAEQKNITVDLPSAIARLVPSQGTEYL
jgi:hypothetical protein